MNLDLKRILRWRSLMALVLMFWCAGVGCMIVSYARASMTDSSGSTVAAEHVMSGASSSMGEHACCKAKHRSSSATKANAQFEAEGMSLVTLPATPTQSGVMDCCPLMSGSIVTASRPQPNDRATLLHQADSSSLVLISSNPSPLAVPLRLPNQSQTYLRVCVFLI